jgi:hypothetical protein
MSRTLSSQARPNPSKDCSAQIIAVVFVISGRKHQAQDPVSCWFPAACAAKAEEWPNAEARRRVFKPTHQLMCEGLPQPDI